MNHQLPRPNSAPTSGVAVDPASDGDVRSRIDPHELWPLLVSAHRAASLLGIGRTTLYQLIGDGDLAPIRIGRCVRFSFHELEQFVEQRLANR